MSHIITTSKGDMEAVLQLCLNHRDELKALCGGEEKAEATLEDLRWQADEDKD